MSVELRCPVPFAALSAVHVTVIDHILNMMQG